MSPGPRRSPPGTRLVVGLALLAAGLTGCAGPPILSGGLSVSAPEGSSAPESGGYGAARYAHAGSSTATFVLTAKKNDGSNAVRRATVIRMFWQPWAGSTAVDPSATNAAVHHVVFRDGAAAIYRGAGFVYPHQEPGADPLRITLSETELVLEKASPGFDPGSDRLLAAGRIDVALDDAATAERIGALSDRLAERFETDASLPLP